MGIISIEGMEFKAFHGCFEEEQVIGNKFVVDVIIEANTKEAEITDDLTKTINYQEIYKIVQHEIGINSKLIEHLGRRIVNKIKLYYPAIQNIKVKISKINPSLSSGGFTQKVSVSIED